MTESGEAQMLHGNTSNVNSEAENGSSVCVIETIQLVKSLYVVFGDVKRPLSDIPVAESDVVRNRFKNSIQTTAASYLR